MLDRMLETRRDALADSVIVLRNDRYCLPIAASARSFHDVGTDIMKVEFPVLDLLARMAEAVGGTPVRLAPPESKIGEADRHDHHGDAVGHVPRRGRAGERRPAASRRARRP